MFAQKYIHDIIYMRIIIYASVCMFGKDMFYTHTLNISVYICTHEHTHTYIFIYIPIYICIHITYPHAKSRDWSPTRETACC